MIRWHERNPWLALVVLFAGAFFVDVVRLVVSVQGLGLDRVPADGYGIGEELFGLPNVAFVWLFAQQIGFCLRDGWFSRARWWNLVMIVAGFAGLGLLVILGEYSASMLTNQWPPNLSLAVLAVIQAGLLTLLHRPLTAIMETRPAQAIVFFLGSRLMSVYLWHVPAIVVLTGIRLLWLPMPDPGTGAWWLTRPILVVAVLLIVWAISTITKRWESPPADPLPEVALRCRHRHRPIRLPFPGDLQLRTRPSAGRPQPRVHHDRGQPHRRETDRPRAPRPRISDGRDATIAEVIPPTPGRCAAPPVPPRCRCRSSSHSAAAAMRRLPSQRRGAG